MDNSGEVYGNSIFGGSGVVGIFVFEDAIADVGGWFT